MISADKKYKHIKETKYEWSPSLVKYGGTVSFWKKRKATEKGEEPDKDLAWRQQQLGIHNAGGNGMYYINISLRAAREALYDTQYQASQLRKHYLEELSTYTAE